VRSPDRKEGAGGEWKEQTLHGGGGSVMAVAQKVARSGGGSATGVGERFEGKRELGGMRG
jgi:hypothetical protein